MVSAQLVCFQLLVITASIVGSPTGSNEIISCRIPNELEDGFCTEAKRCPAFQDINHVELMGNASRLSFVRELRCELDQQDGVCCPHHGESYQQPWIPTDAKSRERRTTMDTGDVKIDETCGFQSIANRIATGSFALIDEFPWAALLFYKVQTPRCGGVLISRNFVLTAAHCLTGKYYDEHGPLEFVRLREYNLLSDHDCLVDAEFIDCIEGGAIDKPPLLIKVHPGFNEGHVPYHHDIGLIKINLTAKFDDFLRPICLPEAGRLTGLNRGNILTVCGWGQINLFEIKYAYPIKMKTNLPYVDLSECQEIYPNHQLVSGQICAGGRLKDPCIADSGSSLMFYDRYQGVWVLSGIASSGPKYCGTIGKPGIYSSVVEYLPWIKESTGL